MTPESTYLISLAERLTQPYTELPSLKAAMITGSAAKGVSDRYSDIDMTMYYAKQLPTEEELTAIRHQLGAGDRRWVIGNREEGSFAAAYELHGIEVQIGHTLISKWEETIEFVKKAEDVNTTAQKAMEGTLACKALYGDELIDKWKDEISDFPDHLARAMVEKNLQFFAIWGLEPHFRTRDASIWYYQILVECAQRLVGVWAGLNKLYFTTFQFKRQSRFIKSMSITPDNAAERIETLFTTEMNVAVTDLEALVAETIELVETHMPEVDTSMAKRRIGWRIEPWVMEVA